MTKIAASFVLVISFLSAASFTIADSHLIRQQESGASVTATSLTSEQSDEAKVEHQQTYDYGSRNAVSTQSMEPSVVANNQDAGHKQA